MYRVPTNLEEIVPLSKYEDLGVQITANILEGCTLGADEIPHMKTKAMIERTLKMYQRERQQGCEDDPTLEFYLEGSNVHPQLIVKRNGRNVLIVGMDCTRQGKLFISNIGQESIDELLASETLRERFPGWYDQP